MICWKIDGVDEGVGAVVWAVEVGTSNVDSGIVIIDWVVDDAVDVDVGTTLDWAVDVGAVVVVVWVVDVITVGVKVVAFVVLDWEADVGTANADVSAINADVAFVVDWVVGVVAADVNVGTINADIGALVDWLDVGCLDVENITVNIDDVVVWVIDVGAVVGKSKTSSVKWMSICWLWREQLSFVVHAAIDVIVSWFPGRFKVLLQWNIYLKIDNLRFCNMYFFRACVCFINYFLCNNWIII